jgi:hypothetical protein
MSEVDIDKDVLSRKAWLFSNEKTLCRILRGMKQAEAGELKGLGSFAQYIDEEDDAIPLLKDEIKFE